ncbi:MAG: 6-phosphogluconolactonase [Gammaproteobacteria bacterium]|nr:6-phosphogluconolactonase [Gammaproteobacteria bacterium]
MRAELTVSLAARAWELVDEAISATDEAAIVLAGGSTPVPLYNTLRELPLPWSRLTIAPSDERWVGIDHEASNEGMLRREFFASSATDANVVSLARHEDDIERDAARVERALARRTAPWDFVLLGMGTDGHTASLFPGAPELPTALSAERRCVPVTPQTADHRRLTLSAAELLNSRRIILLLTGQEKWDVYREACADDDISAMPVRAILHQQQTPVDVYWSAN